MENNLLEMNFEEMTFSYLMVVRDMIMKEINRFEKQEKSGYRLVNEWEDINKTSQQYEENLELLIQILSVMADKYDENTLMIEAASSDEELEFIKNVFWADSNDAEKKVPEIFINGAKEILDKLISEDNAEAMNIKGAMYTEGRSVEQNDELSFEWYKKAADAGDSLAMSNVGFAYYYGNGVNVSLENAYKYWSMAVTFGELDSYIALGDMYQKGEYVPKNYIRAFELYDRCYREVDHSELNDAFPACLVRLGECFANGMGVDINRDLATKMFAKAIDIYKYQISIGNYYAPKCIERAEEDLEVLSCLL